jgi:hypothetical protein
MSSLFTNTMKTLVLTLPAQAPRSASSLFCAALSLTVMALSPDLTRRRVGAGARGTTVGSIRPPA